MLDCLLIRRGMLAAILLLPLVAHAQSTDAHAILDASDRNRNPPGSFSVKLQLSEYRQGKLANSNVLTVYARPSETDATAYIPRGNTTLHSFGSYRHE